MFGKIFKEKMELNEAGLMVDRIWRELPDFYPDVLSDEFVVMPNHMHGIIIIGSHANVGAGPRACPQSSCMPAGQPQGVASTNSNLSLSDVIHRFKSLTTNQYLKNIKQNNRQPFSGKLWQRNYYEHVIRNDIDLTETREYIHNNPKKWDLDRNNPINIKTSRINENV